MMVRGKFRLSSITNDAGYTASLFVFNAVGPADGELEENQKYHKYTPAGKIEISVDNPPAQVQFKLGDYYYVDFTTAK
jgi:hypothetical protein